MKKTCAILLSYGLLFSLACTGNPTEAATIKLSKKNYSMYVGSSYTLKVKGTRQKVKWSSNKKSIAKVNAKGTVTGVKAGTAKITAKVGKKKLSCKITIKKRPLGKGTKASPKSAYVSNRFTFYEEGKKMGSMSMKLERFESGDAAAELAAGNSTNPTPSDRQEYIYFRFKITYHSGNQTINAKDVFNYYYNIFGNNSTKQLTNLDWGFFFEDVDDLGKTLLSPGNTVVCSKAILVEKGTSPITYRIQTGKNSYTWFTTEK